MRTLTTSVFLCGFMAAALPFQAALAQNYPTKLVRVINGYAAGGPNDLIARPILQYLTGVMGQQFIMENKAGANGNIGADEVVRAAPDGYTFLFSTTSQITINPALYKMPFDAQKDLAPIIQVSMNPSSVVMNAGFPAKNMQEVIAYAKANPGKLTFSSAGNGSINHLAAELLSMVSGIKMLHIPMSGGGPALTEVLAGRVDMFVVSPPVAIPGYRAGKLKIMMISADKRMSQIPDVPIMTEAGIPGFLAQAGTGFLAPSKTSPVILRRMHAEVQKYLKSPEAEKQLGAQGVQIVGGTTEEFAQLIRDETTRWAGVVKTVGIKLE